jgi:hypothetical protein
MTDHQHQWIEVTTMGDQEARFTCATCHATMSESRSHLDMCDCYCHICETTRRECCQEPT